MVHSVSTAKSNFAALLPEMLSSHYSGWLFCFTNATLGNLKLWKL